MPTDVQVHGVGGAAGVIWYALMAKKELVTELYGKAFCICIICGLSCQLASCPAVCATCLAVRGGFGLIRLSYTSLSEFS